MSVPDIINALLEVAWSVVLGLSIRKLRRDKSLKGISLWHVALVLFSSGWFTFYYAHLDQWFSFAASFIYAGMVATWVGHIAYYLMPRPTDATREWLDKRWSEAL